MGRQIASGWALYYFFLQRIDWAGGSVIGGKMGQLGYRNPLAVYCPGGSTEEVTLSSSTVGEIT